MARAREMQGVAAHKESLRSDGERRHPAWCVYALGKGKARLCTSTECILYEKNCRSAKYCQWYKKRADIREEHANEEKC